MNLPRQPGFPENVDRTLSPFACAALIALVLGLTRLTWLKWGFPVNDTGYDLMAAWKWSRGLWPYRDMAYSYGPVVPVLQGSLFRLFGPHLSVFIACGFLALGVGGWLVFRISRLFLGRLESFGVVAVFMLESGFQHYTANNIYNFILPYTLSATYGLLAALGAFLCLSRFLDTDDRRALALAGTLAGLSFLCKIEVGSAAAATIGIVCAARRLLPAGARPGALLADAAAAGGPFAALVALALLPFVAASSLEQVVLGNMFRPELVDVRQGPFLMNVAGYLALKDNLRWMGLSAAIWAGAIGLLLAGNRLMARRPRMRARVIGLGMILAAFALALLSLDYGRKFRCFPLVVLVTLTGAALPGLRERRALSPDEWRLAALALLSFFMFARILLRVEPTGYGFYLAVPATILFFVFLLRVVPGWLAGSSFRTPVWSLLVVALVLSLSVKDFVRRSLPFYRLYQIELRGPGGRMKALDITRNASIRDALDWLREHRGEVRNLAVIPGGVVNFLAGIPSPIYQNLFSPLELGARGAEMRAIRELREQSVDWILIIDWSAREHGYEGFGLDYGLRMMRAIDRDYVFRARFGPEGYGCVLYRRKTPVPGTAAGSRTRS